MIGQFRQAAEQLPVQDHGAVHLPFVHQEAIGRPCRVPRKKLAARFHLFRAMIETNPIREDKKGTDKQQETGVYNTTSHPMK